ncbi:MAG TPA: hypothetical protein VGL78_05130 [Solirubrobacteraceae bacterium]
MVAAVSLLTAGCGGGSPTTAATGQNELLAYSNCMRSHGVPNFPDPTSNQGIDKGKIIPLVGSPHFQAASNACQHLMPATGLGPPTTTQPTRARFAAALAFARCVRDRGFSNFPDPTVGGQLTPEMVSAAGIDLHQPALLHAGLACAPVTHGLITRAAVERAVKGG